MGEVVKMTYQFIKKCPRQYMKIYCRKPNSVRNFLSRFFQFFLEIFFSEDLHRLETGQLISGLHGFLNYMPGYLILLVFIGGYFRIDYGSLQTFFVLLVDAIFGNFPHKHAPFSERTRLVLFCNQSHVTFLIVMRAIYY